MNFVLMHLSESIILGFCSKLQTSFTLVQLGGGVCVDNNVPQFRIATIFTMTKRQTKITPIIIIATIFIIVCLTFYFNAKASLTPEFDHARAYEDVAFQMSLGPRTIGSTAHARAREWIAATLREQDWRVEIQQFEHSSGIPLYNIVAKRGSGAPWIILGAHYDSRFVADRDPDETKRSDPVPGANDGASGVAVLLELSRSLPDDLDKQIWLVFFDAEDNGHIPGWDWILGSREFVASLDAAPQAVVVVDMVGDEELQIFLERNSNAELAHEIWDQANALGYQQFVPVYRHRILDDHIPFVDAGIPAVDIIDFDYPYWHTTSDTIEHVSSVSLDAVGETLLAWLLR